MRYGTYNHLHLLSTVAMISQLPDDVLAFIAEFVQSPTLSHVFRRTWRRLQGRHLLCEVNGANLERIL